ncbi:hypothetical protein [Streptomyces sp. NPDC057686]|uniref:hypothetical protein n=1 Tax=Streptomyces sp. NPDC057686 TaxID=3346212 RepID=UPI0036923E29
MVRYIEVLADAGGEADGQQQEEARAELVAALEELGVSEVRVRERPAPPGSKSGGLTTAEILVAVGPPLFAAVVAAFESWVQWAGSRQVRVRIGEDEFEAARLTDTERQRLLDHFIARTTRVEEPPSGGA